MRKNIEIRAKKERRRRGARKKGNAGDVLGLKTLENSI
jgi:hypothetical protein